MPISEDDVERQRLAAQAFVNESQKTANLWSIYIKEAASRDKALLETWKGDMESVIIFAGLFSASLTSFLVQSYLNLKPQSDDQTAFFAQQSVILLAHISQQLSSGGSSVPMPDFSTTFVPQPPSRPDVITNTLWFMSLTFSLTAALFAIILQQWTRDYLQIFQRYDDAPKCARVRQYMTEGSEHWKVSFMIDAIPVLIHISLFLFFAGLSEFLFELNSIVAIATTSVIGFSAVLYFMTIIGPVIWPQFPYQSPMANLLWWLLQLRLWPLISRTYKRPDEDTDFRVSATMLLGRDQIANSVGDARRRRDAKAIHWLINNLTEESELEPFVHTIPDSILALPDVWKQMMDDENAVSPFVTAPMEAEKERSVMYGHAHAHHETTSPALHSTRVKPREQVPLHDLGRRIGSLLKTCTSSSLLNEKLRLKRARACIEASYTLLHATKKEEIWLHETDVLVEVLSFLGSQKPNLFTTCDNTWSTRYLCMSMLALRRVLSSVDVRAAAAKAVQEMSGALHLSGPTAAEDTARFLDEKVVTAWNAVREIDDKFKGIDSQTSISSAVNSCEEHLAILESLWNAVGWASSVDDVIGDFVRVLTSGSKNLIFQIPGAMFETWIADNRPQFSAGPRAEDLPPFSTHFLPPRTLIYRLWLTTWTLRNFGFDNWNRPVAELQKQDSLCPPEIRDERMCNLLSGRGQDNSGPFLTQLYRLQDLSDGGFVYLLEIFFNVIREQRLGSIEAAHESIFETFMILSSGWAEHQDHVPSQKALFSLLLRLQGDNSYLPTRIVLETMILMARVIDGKDGVDDEESSSLIRLSEFFFTFVREQRLGSIETMHESVYETFMVLSSGWAKYQDHVPSQKALISLLPDVLTDNSHLPLPVVLEMVLLTARVMGGKDGAHVEGAITLIRNYVEPLSSSRSPEIKAFATEVKHLISH